MIRPEYFLSVAVKFQHVGDPHAVGRGEGTRSFVSPVKFTTGVGVGDY